MKLKACFMVVGVILWVVLGNAQAGRAQGRALEQLLDLFEKKGLVSTPEAERIRKALAEDRKEALKKEKEIQEREKALVERERELRKREDALREREEALYAKEQGTRPGTREAAETRAEGTAKGGREVKALQKGLPLETTYDDGFCLRAGGEEGISLCLGGLLQADHRYYDYPVRDPDKNKFDLRRVRLILKGKTGPRLDYKFEYEFQGAGSRRLLDAYGDLHLFPFTSLQVGQFKEPFGLEQCTKDKNLFFAERSMAYYMTPRRDVGVMAHGSFLDDRIHYGVGLFNGDGQDDSTGGDEDDPQLTGRLVLLPLKDRGPALVENLQIGGSFGYARIDRNNVDIHIKTAGLTPFFDVASRAKFNIIREVKSRSRYGAEVGWTYGPLALMGEYVTLRFKDVETSSERFNVRLRDYYLGLLWMVTGERPAFKDGKFQPIRPNKPFWQGGWGGLGLAFRYDLFKADQGVYENLIYVGNSVREAEAYTVAVNWYLNGHTQVILDATRTLFDKPLLIDRDSLTGTSIFSDREDVVAGRFQLKF